MVARGPGAVGCAHCKTIGAEHACQVCARLVCAACAANWATCDEPSGRIVRLGMTARVRDVDPLGRLALVSHWRRPLRVFDLRQLRWATHVDLPRRLYLWARAFPPRLRSDGRLIHAEMMLPQRDDLGFLGFRVLSLADGESKWLDRVDGDTPQHGTAVSAVGDVFWFVADTQRVVVIREPSEALPASSEVVALAGPAYRRLVCTVTSYEPLPRRVVQAAHVDAEHDVLAVASWSEVSLHRMVDTKLERLAHVRTEREGDVRWIATAGGWLAAAVQPGSAPTTIELRKIARDGSLGPVVMHHRCAAAFKAASLSRDGRYLAVGEGHTLVVLDLERDEVTRFDEHTDAINLVRFAADDHVLVSADTDHRLILRPRTSSGYARPLIPVPLDAG